jgi:hypothetical protein
MVENDQPDIYEAMTCIACGRVHLVNPPTGKTPGEERESGASSR